MNRTLFDAPAQPPARDPQPVTVNRQPTTSHPYGADVARVIQRPSGPFMYLDGGSGRPHVVLHTKDDEYWIAYPDASLRVPLDWDEESILRAIRRSSWVVVWEQGR